MAYWCAVGLFIVVSANAQRRDRGTADSGILTTKTRRHEGTQRKSSRLFLVSSSPCLLFSLPVFPVRLKARYLHDEGVLADWILARRLVGQILARLKGGEHKA